MAASSLRCVAIAYRTYELDKIPTEEEHLTQWALPEDDLVLLGIVGIKVSKLAFSYLDEQRVCRMWNCLFGL